MGRAERVGEAMLNSITEWELQILMWIQEHLRVPFLTPIVQFITSLGDHGIIWIAACLVLIGYKKTRRVGVVAAASLILNAVIVNLVLKTWIMRIRPFVLEEGLELITQIPSDYSFPSGHTSAAFATAVILFLGLPKKIGIPAMVLAVLMGISRLYVGVHFPTDVLAGAIIGTLAAMLTWYIFSKCVFKELDKGYL